MTKNNQRGGKLEEIDLGTLDAVSGGYCYDDYSYSYSSYSYPSYDYSYRSYDSYPSYSYSSYYDSCW